MTHDQEILIRDSFAKLEPIVRGLAYADELKAEVRGREITTGLPKTVVLSPEEVRYALRDQVDILLDVFVHFVEELVKSDEIRTLDVPVRLFALGLQIDCVGESCVENVDHLAANGFGQIVLCRVHGALLEHGLVETRSRK